MEEACRIVLEKLIGKTVLNRQSVSKWSMLTLYESLPRQEFWGSGEEVKRWRGSVTTYIYISVSDSPLEVALHSFRCCEARIIVIQEVGGQFAAFFDATQHAPTCTIVDSHASIESSQRDG